MINIMIFVALALVALTLLSGLWTMAQGAGAKAGRSNKLMRLRVVLQGIAVIMLMIGFALKANSGG